jgi:hypothetical protein
MAVRLPFSAEEEAQPAADQLCLELLQFLYDL